MAGAVDYAYEVMISNLKSAYKGELAEISNAYNAEDRINNLRDYYRDVEIENLERNGNNYQTSVYFMDVISEFEKMGDFMINISQTLQRSFILNR